MRGLSYGYRVAVGFFVAAFLVAGAACGGAAEERSGRSDSSEVTGEQHSTTAMVEGDREVAQQEESGPTPSPPLEQTVVPESEEAAEARANLLAALRGIERYFSINDTYAGITVASIQASYDAGFPFNISFGESRAYTYCIESTVGEATYRKNGPDAEIEQDSCVSATASAAAWADSANVVCVEATPAWSNAVANIFASSLVATLGEENESGVSIQTDQLAQYEWDIRQALGEASAIYEERLNDLATLPRPWGAAEQVDELLDAMRAELAILQEYALVAENATDEQIANGDPELAARLDALDFEAAQTRVIALASELAADACVRLEQEPFPPGSLEGAASQPETDDLSQEADASAVVRGAIPAVEAWYADHDAYAGMSPDALRRDYDAGIRSSLRVVRAGATSYCIDATVDGQSAHKNGPPADIELGRCDTADDTATEQTGTTTLAGGLPGPAGMLATLADLPDGFVPDGADTHARTLDEVLDDEGIGDEEADIVRDTWIEGHQAKFVRDELEIISCSVDAYTDASSVERRYELAQARSFGGFDDGLDNVKLRELTLDQEFGDQADAFRLDVEIVKAFVIVWRFETTISTCGSVGLEGATGLLDLALRAATAQQARLKGTLD